MRQTLILLTILIYGCSPRQEPSNTTHLDTAINLKNSAQKIELKPTTICDQPNLSNQFDLSIHFRRFTDTIEHQDSCSLTVFIKDKSSKENLDSIFITSLFYFEDIFLNCDNMTSYSTKYNSNRQVVDNYFGDIVVADLNFDDKDDIAVINDCGGNGGPLYSYFIQTSNRKFTLDKFLTDSVRYFPDKIDKSKKRLITIVHAGACCVGEHIYHVDKTANKWRQTSHKILGR